MRHLILTATLCLLAVAGAFSQNKIFTGLVNNNWDEPNNWSPQGVPTATDDDSIPPSEFVIMPFSPISVAGLRLGTGVTLTGGTSSSINITQFGRSQGAFVGVPLTVASGAVFHLHSLSNWDNSFYEGLTNNGTFNYYEGVLNLGPGEITNSGQFFGKDQPGQTVEKNIYSYGLGITNNAGAIFRHENANASGGLPFNIWVPFLNNGALQVRENTEGITFYNDFTNNANIQFASSGIFNFDGVNSLSTCTFNPGGGITAPVGPLSWNGFFSLTGDVNINYAITVNNNTAWTFQNGTVGGTGSFNFVDTDGVQFVQNSVLQIPVTNGAGQLLGFGVGAAATNNTLSAILTNNGRLSVLGDLEMNNGTITNNDILEFDFNDPKTISNGGGVNLITNNKFMYVSVPTFFQIKVENKTAASRLYPGNSVAVDFATLFDNEGEIVPNDSPTSSIGTASLKEAFQFTSTSVTNIEFDGAAHDFIQILGLNNDLTLNGGTLNINVIGATPPPGNYVIIDVPNNLRPASGNRQLLGINGSFTTINLPPGATLNNNGTQIFITFAFPPPDITCPPDATVSTDVSGCFSNYTFPPPTGTTDPSCEPITYTADPPAPYSLGTTTVTFTGTDACGGTASCQTTITVEDNDPPDIICPNDFTVSTTSGTCTACPPLPPPSIFDYCDSQPGYFTDAPDCSTQFFQLGTTTVTYTAFDDAGNTATCSLDVTVEDNEPPVINCPSPVTVSAGANCQGIMPDLTLSASASDNCGVASITQAPPPGSSIPVGTTTVVLTATDPSGNTATCSAIVNVVDDEPPTITCPPDVNVDNDPGECGASVSVGPPTVNDNCGVESLDNSYNGTSDASDFYDVGVTTVTWTVEDVYGLQSTCAMTVTVNDAEPPTITCPADVIDNALPGLCYATPSIGDATVSDNCAGGGGTGSVSNGGQTWTQTGQRSSYFDVTNVSVAPINVTRIRAKMWNNQTSPVNVTVQVYFTTTAMTSVGNQTNPGAWTLNTTVTKTLVGQGIGNLVPQDVEIVLASPVTLQVDQSKGFSLQTNLQYGGGPVSAQQNGPAFSNGTALVSNGTISSGNFANLLPGNFQFFGTIDYTTASGGGSLTPTNNAPSTFPVGTTVVTYSVVDAGGNIAQCDQFVTILDNQPPSITCPPPALVNTDPGTCAASVPDFIAGATYTDNCAVESVTQDPPAGQSFPPGIYLVTLTASDSTGNFDTCSVSLTIRDGQSPTLVCPPDATVSTDAGVCSANFTPPPATATDNCTPSGQINIFYTPSITNFPLGTTSLVYTAVDLANNSSQCSMQLTVVDDEPPVITCPANITANAATGTCQATVSIPNATATDNCTSAPTITRSPSGSVFLVGTTTITFTATDASGNAATCQMTVTVLDTQAPVIVGCPQDIFADTDPGSCEAVVSFTPPSVVDNCPGATIVQTGGLPSGSAFPLGTTTNTFVATDSSGNAVNCTFTVVVTDNEAPSIVCPPNVTLGTDAGVCTANFTPPPATATDNCTPSGNITIITPPGGNFPLGNTTLVYNAIDLAGNSSQCTMLLTVVDDEPPVITCPTSITANAATGTCQATVSIPNATATDNCTSSPTITRSPAGNVFQLGTTTVTFTATDAAGNTDQCDITVTVNDVQAPAITCPPNVNTTTDPGVCSATFTLANATATDNCPGSVSITNNAPPGNTFQLGTTTVTFTATDAQGNTVTCTMNVTVVDDEPPVLLCPDDVTIQTAPGTCQSAPFAIPNGTATDNCTANPTITNNAPTGGIYPLGNTNVTFTATDAAGNIDQCVAVVTVEDNEAPVITFCPVGDLVETEPGLCTAEFDFDPLTATDNCTPSGSLAISSNPPFGFDFPVGTTTVTFTVTDASGNTAQCTAEVEVEDTEEPIIICPVTYIEGTAGVNCDTTVTIPAPTVIDNCGATVTNDAPPGNLFSYYDNPTIVTFTATDAAGNQAFCEVEVVINDLTAPVLTCPDNVTISTSSSNCNTTLNLPPVVAVDNCVGPITAVQSPPNGTQLPFGTSSISYTATDNDGNESICTISVTVTDSIAPAITCPANVTVGSNPTGCEGTATLTATATDNCTPPPTIVQNPPGNIFQLGTTTVTFTATDGAGNTANCTTTVTVQDNVPPAITCPANITANTDAGTCTFTAPNFAATATDNCTAPTAINISQNPPGNVFQLGTTTVTFTATDANNNTAGCTASVTVNDTQLPTLTCPANTTVSTNTNTCEGTANLTASATDNCTPTGGINITQNPPGSIFPIGPTTLTFTATDAAGNIASCTATVTVEDTQLPTLDCPDDLTVNTDANVCTGTANLTATATDNCPATPPTIAQSPSGNTFPLGPTTVTFTATDGGSNTFSCQTVVTVEDAQQPSITCPADLTVGTDAGVCTGTANLSATAADNCPATPPTISQSPTGNTFPLGPTTVTFTATDASGNQIACSMQVTVEDAQQPSITCPADLTVGTDAGVCTGTANLTATATDNCTASGNLTISQSPTGNTFQLGTTTVTFSTTDASGNQFSCTTLVTVEDTQTPVLDCPDDLTVGTDAGVCTGTANLTATATDNCTASGNLTITQSPSGNTFPLGATTVTFTATDAGGNTLACTMSVTVQDVQPPVFQNCPATTLDLQTDAGQCTATADFTPFTASATDNCTSPVPVQGPASNVFPVGAGQTATFTATDDAGQTSVCTITINVADAEPPTLACPPNLTLATAPGTCAATPDFSQIMPTDNCGVQNLTTNPPGSIAAGSPVQVTFTATDAGGNSTVCITEVEVFDTEAPQFDNCPGALTIPTDAGLCSATFSFTNITASDNCDGALPVQGPTTGTFQLGPNPPVLLSATDAAGTAASCAVTVTVEDQEPPNITCPPNVVTDPDPGECTATVNLDPASATDNCTANLTIETMPSAPGNTFPVGTTVITYMATDDMGNEDICQTSITVNGTDVLSITCPLPQNLDAGAGCSVTVPFQDATFVALCGLQSLDNNWPPNDEFPVGQTLVTFTVTDVAGGTEACQTVVTVTEAVPPTFAGCPNDLTVLANLPGCQATAGWGTPLATDNCTPASQVSTAQPGDIFALGTTMVTYTAADLNGNTAICQFSVTVNPASTVSTLDTAVCAGRPVTVGGSTFTAPGTYTVNLTNALGCDSTVTLNLANVTQLFGTATATICAGQSILLGGALQTEAGFYMDTLTALGGCDSIVTTELFVNPTPTFSIMGPISICPGVFAVLSAGLFSQYQWSPGGATTPQISVDQPGIYAATVTDANGCTASDVFDLTTVYCGPVTAAFAVARDTACANLFVGFTDQSLGNVQEWHWDFGNGNFSTLQNPSTYFPNPGDYTVRLIVRDGLDADTATRRIHIYPQIKGNFTTTVPDLCHPLELDFAGTAMAKFGVDVWRWNFGDGNTGTGQNTSHDYPNYGTANATLVIQDKFGCVDSLSRDVDISPNSVAPQPVFIQKILCPGESFTVGATVFDETNLTGAVVLVSAAGCDSVVNVAVSYIPGGNISLGADTVICENQSLTLDAGPATNYLWSTGATTQTITVTQAGTYSVVISNNGNCAASGQITVGVDAIPSLQADAGADAAICSSQQFFKMNAAAPSVGTGRWSTAGTAILDNPASPQSFVSQLANGNNIFTWTLDNGACKAYSSDNVTVSVTPEVNETANAGPDLAFCASGATVQLAALAPASPGVVGTWAQTSGAPLNIADPNDPQTTVTGLNATDIYTLEWTLSNGACGDFSSNEVNISLSSKVLAAANAGDNASLCQQSTLQLNANQPPPGGTAIWTIDGTSPAAIADAASPNTVVSAIPPGTTRLIWTFSTPLCPNYSADTLIVFQSSGLEANDDAYLFLGQPLTNLDFVANDAVGDPDNVTLTLTGTPSLGKVNRNQDGTHDFSFMGDAPGATSFGYEICLKACPNVCDEAFVTIGVKSDSVPVLIRPRNVFTPNGDGVGDRMVIENFDDITTDIVLIVLNRWGNIVYETKKYNNDWEGRDNDGNPLPEGSYIYILRGGGIGPDGDNEETGVITIMR
ncbi:MAG: HYR domain-containing protein [Saprospiraceae bacterium]